MASSQGMQLQLQPIITMLVLVQVVVVVVVLSLSAATIAAPPTEQDLKNLGYMNRCKNVNISYPFGVKEKCYINEHFLINCTDSKPYLRKSDIPVTNISLEEGELGIMYPVTCACYGGYVSKCYQPPELVLLTFPMDLALELAAAKPPSLMLCLVEGFEERFGNGNRKDIKECEDPKLNMCEHKNKCVDMPPGNYTCSCPEGYHSDGRTDGKGCIANQFLAIQIAVDMVMGPH
ncbi:hypothetical protein ACSBR1_001292 [Camellia fascicularis]